MSYDFDVCVIGSGAGGGPVAFTLAKAGYSVLVLEKGPWLTEKDFFKDELACCRRNIYTSNLREEPHVVEMETDEGGWTSQSTYQSGWNFWNGNCVGGSSNFMSGFFHRLKPVDFKLRTVFGSIEGADVADWPISYADLEPYYDKVEREIGVSGRLISHPHAEPRSRQDFPYPPTAEHPISKYIDEACGQMDLHSIPMPRAILPYSALERQGCSYNGYCGSYACATGAKGSSRAALLDRAVATGFCQIRPNAMVSRIISDQTGKITAVEYYDKNGQRQLVDAKIVVIACQAIETARLLLNSPGPKHQNGLANNNHLVGKNLLFAGGGAGSGRLPYAKFSPAKAAELRQFAGPFVNRSIQDWYIIDDPTFGVRQKGGTIDFVHLHPNPIARATRQIRGRSGLLWGKPLKEKVKAHFLEGIYLKIEAFCDWLPIPDCYVTLDPSVKDKWGLPVARIRVGFHVRNLQVGWYLAERGAEVLKQMGAENVISFAAGAPPTNLVAGGCRFGNDPKTSVLNANCRAHEVENLYITDGSFMPTGGSVPYTWTIYANAFRVAENIVEQLGGNK
ncbi:MAG: oxidoreductase [Gammaproteobacteria bacterium]|nr:MAG: oxidoreductase [Gammaproteobacteria bacterium]RKZ71681.1 MAG: oxidoreductase [Gammaproteobacteria bacterium]